MSEVADFIRQLDEGIQETMATIAEIPEDYLDELCRHGCARGGTIWSLLTHNIEHEKMHYGNIIGVRDTLRKLQQDRKSRLMYEYYVARSMLIACLFGLEDETLDRVPGEGRWTIRQEIEHVMSVDRGSISDMIAEYHERRVAAAAAG